MRLFYRRSKEAPHSAICVTLSDAARHRPSICYQSGLHIPI